MKKGKKYVLSLDGGGIRGIIPAVVLAKMEEQTDKSISEMFDLIVGTSTGGILALGLTKKGGNGKVEYTANDLLKLYTEEGSEIFSRTCWHRMKSLEGWMGTKYPAENIEKILEEYFGKELLSNAANNVVVTCYETSERELYLFKSWMKKYNQVEMWKAARGTSAAPTFFPPLQLEESVLIDGGIYVNNPAMSAYVEAKKLYPNDFIVVVSIGAGQLTRPYSYNKVKGWGILSGGRPLFNCMLDGVSDVADYQTGRLLNKQGFYRFQVELKNASDDLDDCSSDNIKKLQKEAERLLSEEKGEFGRLINDLKLISS